MSLSMGATGTPVKELQSALNLLPTQLALLKIDGIFGIRTHGRVSEFQGFNALGIDGIAGTLTLAAIELAISLLRNVVPPQSAITLTQKNAKNPTSVHTTTTPIVLPPITVTHDNTFRFSEVPNIGRIHEFLFEVRKAGSVFWVGAAVPETTTDFTRAYVFFHPTVKQGKVVIAADEDYPDFKGGWSALTQPVGSIQRYVALQGGQLATAGLKMPMLVPFTTMAAVNSPAKSNMFTTDPVGTLTAVVEAIQNEMKGRATPRPTLSKLGVASFSSGIHALRLFLGSMATSGLIKEVVDLDSPAIIGNPHALTRSVGAASKCFSMAAPTRPSAGYVTVTRTHFSRVTAFSAIPENEKFDRRLHARIGFMMFHQALRNSALR